MKKLLLPPSTRGKWYWRLIHILFILIALYLSFIIGTLIFPSLDVKHKYYYSWDRSAFSNVKGKEYKCSYFQYINEVNCGEFNSIDDFYNAVINSEMALTWKNPQGVNTFDLVKADVGSGKHTKEEVVRSLFSEDVSEKLNLRYKTTTITSSVVILILKLILCLSIAYILTYLILLKTIHYIVYGKNKEI